MSYEGPERRQMSHEHQEIMKRLGDIELQIAVGVTESKNSHRAFRDFEAETKKTNQKLEETLNGNGHPENGLIYKNHKNTEFRLFWERFGWLILAGFAGVPCTVVAGIVLYIVKGA